MTRSLLFVLALVALACDGAEPPPSCVEVACRATWASNCYCYGGARLEVQADGTFICRCPRDAGADS